MVEGGAVPPQAERGNALTRGALTSWGIIVRLGQPPPGWVVRAGVARAGRRGAGTARGFIQNPESPYIYLYVLEEYEVRPVLRTSDSG